MTRKSSTNSRQDRNSRQTKGEGSTFQRKDGRWIAQVTLEDGTQKQFYAKTEKEAKTRLRAALAEAEQGTILPDRDQPLSQYLEHWLEQIEPTLSKRVAIPGIEAFWTDILYQGWDTCRCASCK